jgi:hypothetical protein
MAAGIVMAAGMLGTLALGATPNTGASQHAGEICVPITSRFVMDYIRRLV